MTEHELADLHPDAHQRHLARVWWFECASAGVGPAMLLDAARMLGRAELMPPAWLGEVEELYRSAAGLDPRVESQP